MKIVWHLLLMIPGFLAQFVAVSPVYSPVVVPRNRRIP